MSNWPDSPKEIVTALLTVGGLLGVGRKVQTGGLSRLWGSIISFLAAPVERSLAQREARAYRQDNDRLRSDNDRKDQEIARLRALLSPGSSDGSSGNGDGTPTLPLAPSTDGSTGKA